MSLAGFDVLFEKFPGLREKLERLEKYLDETNLSEGDIIDLSHASISTDIEKSQLEQILDRAEQYRIFDKIYRLKCTIEDGFVNQFATKPSMPSKFFCDLCGESHTFDEVNVYPGYRLKGVIASEELKKLDSSMPILGYLSSKLSSKYDDPSFASKRFLIILHFLKDLIIFLQACRKLGLQPKLTHVFYKPYLYPQKERIATHLRSKGYNVYSAKEDLKSALTQLEEEKRLDTIIIEDGGYIVPLLHCSLPQLLTNSIGAVEQTTKGLSNDKEINNLSMPVFNVAKAKIKRKIEPPHVADAVIRNIESLLPSEKLRGSNVAVMGYGSIGREISRGFKDKSTVTIYDSSDTKRNEAKESGYNVANTSEEAVSDQLLVIGCSGSTSISRSEILNLDHNTYLVSATSDQVEIGLRELKALSEDKAPLESEGEKIGVTYHLRKNNNDVHLIADGYPVNFWADESMPNQVSDLILSLLLVSALEIANKDNQYKSGFHDVDKIANDYEVSKLYNQHYQ